MWKESAGGTITETPLSHNPVLGPPQRRTIERYSKASDAAEPTRMPSGLGCTVL